MGKMGGKWSENLKFRSDVNNEILDLQVGAENLSSS